jgi:hypothetical protein
MLLTQFLHSRVQKWRHSGIFAVYRGETEEGVDTCAATVERLLFSTLA